MTDQKKTSTASAALQDFIAGLEVDIVGIASLADWKGTRLEETALKLLPQTRSVVVFAMEIYSEILNLTSPRRVMGEASFNDLLDRDSEYLNGRLTKIAYDVAKASRSLGLKALPMPASGCPMDARFMEAVLSYKHAGQAAGMGKIGWHSLLITPEFGSRARLSCCLTEAELEPTAAVNVTLGCDSCRLCLDNCPSVALTKPPNGKQYAMNKFACSVFRNAAGGCTECMRICPVGR